MAIFSKRSLEGCLLIDHRNSPGITPEFVKKNKLDSPAVGAGVTYESALVICHACQRDVILNPDRSRERAWCWIHDAYLCDSCGAAQKAGMTCVPFKKRFSDYYDKTARGLTAKDR